MLSTISTTKTMKEIQILVSIVLRFCLIAVEEGSKNIVPGPQNLWSWICYYHWHLIVWLIAKMAALGRYKCSSIERLFSMMEVSRVDWRVTQRENPSPGFGSNKERHLSWGCGRREYDRLDSLTVSMYLALK
jgi:hypothetical protein